MAMQRVGLPGSGVVTSRQVMDRFLENRLDPDYPYPPVLTGFEGIDEIDGGLSGPKLVVLAGLPGFGKTALALDIAVNAAMSGKRVGIFSMGMGAEEIMLRMLAVHAQVNCHNLSLGLYTGDEDNRIVESLKYLAELGIVIDDRPPRTAAELCDDARQAQQQHQLDLLVVDNIQLCLNPVSENPAEETGVITRALKHLAMTLKVPVLAISELSRDVIDERPSRRPKLSDLPEDGSIEEAADVVMFIHRPDLDRTTDDQYTTIRSELIVAKNRNGSVGSVALDFYPRLTTFKTIDLNMETN